MINYLRLIFRPRGGYAYIRLFSRVGLGLFCCLAPLDIMFQGFVVGIDWQVGLRCGEAERSVGDTMKQARYVSPK